VNRRSIPIQVQGLTRRGLFDWEEYTVNGLGMVYELDKDSDLKTNILMHTRGIHLSLPLKIKYGGCFEEI